MVPIFLSQFQIVKPKNHFQQDDLLKWIIQSHQGAADQGQISTSRDVIEKLFLRYAVKSSQISQRYSEATDVLLRAADQEIYKIDETHENGVDISRRSQFFSARAEEIFKKFYDVSKLCPRPDHLIHVTCTGYISPSAAQKIVTEKNWTQSTNITHAYHMGCYAALPAIRLAKSLVSSELPQNPTYRADIVHTEMCSLHMDLLTHTPEQMVVQTLFADGHVKYQVAAVPTARGKNLKIIALLEKLIPETQDEMTWFPAPWGMQMSLSRTVPAKIKSEIKSFSGELLKKANLEQSEMTGAIFAIHPGGPKIIESVQGALDLSEAQITESKKVLFERGNMSSATLPHVWSEILQKGYPQGTRVISYAFGPGLTLFGAVFEVC